MVEGNEEREDPRSRILVATIVCIERDGIEAVTTRRVANEAGVNSAAINYYFGSKENLLHQVLSQTLHETFEQPLLDFDQYLADGKTPLLALRKVLYHYMQYASHYPRIAEAHIRDYMVKQDKQAAFSRGLRTLLEGLHSRLTPALPHLTDKELRVSLGHMWSTLLFFGMAAGLVTDFMEIDLTNETQREVLVDQLVAKLLAAHSDPLDFP
jgi:AcrR family transcriptional regulator